MEDLPPEICTCIFSYACRDNGYTGRSLSLVSKYIHDTSLSVKLQSVSVTEIYKLLAFASSLKNAPKLNCSVRYLHVSCSDWDEEEISDSEVAQAMLDILDKVSHNVEILDVSWHCLISSDLPAYGYLAQLCMPNLRELTTNGSLSIFGPGISEAGDTQPSMKCNNLKRLHISEGVDFEGGELLNRISHWAPSLTHLRLSKQPHGAHWIAKALGVELEPIGNQFLFGTRASADYQPTIKLPTGIKCIIMDITTPEGRMICGRVAWIRMISIRDLRQLNRICEIFTLLEHQENAANGAFWLDRVNGGEGCWKVAPKAGISQKEV